MLRNNEQSKAVLCYNNDKILKLHDIINIDGGICAAFSECRLQENV